MLGAQQQVQTCPFVIPAATGGDILPEAVRHDDGPSHAPRRYGVCGHSTQRAQAAVVRPGCKHTQKEPIPNARCWSRPPTNVQAGAGSVQGVQAGLMLTQHQRQRAHLSLTIWWHACRHASFRCRSWTPNPLMTPAAPLQGTKPMACRLQRCSLLAADLSSGAALLPATTMASTCLLDTLNLCVWRLIAPFAVAGPPRCCCSVGLPA
jgi:hypothetical protein